MPEYWCLRLSTSAIRFDGLLVFSSGSFAAWYCQLVCRPETLASPLACDATPTSCAWWILPTYTGDSSVQQASFGARLQNCSPGAWREFSISDVQHPYLHCLDKMLYAQVRAARLARDGDPPPDGGPFRGIPPNLRAAEPSIKGNCTERSATQSLKGSWCERTDSG
jgi:hypothetical protein